VNRWALAWAVVPAVVACSSSSKVIERSARERPAWVESTPASRDQLYFVGTCTDLPSYQEALRCARAEALADVAAWVGARFSAHVYAASSEVARSSGSAVYYDSEMFLADARRSDTYHEVRQEDWGRSYRVSVLLAYPRREAEAERARSEEATRSAEQRVAAAPASVRAIAAEGRWGDAMARILEIAAEVTSPYNLNRARHADRLAQLAEELVTPLRLSGTLDGAIVEARATFREAPAAGVPLECLYAGASAKGLTGDDGRAECVFDEPSGESAGRARLRPYIRGYLAAVPAEAGALSAALGKLLDQSIDLETDSAIGVTAWLSGGSGCEVALSELQSRLTAVGVRFAADASRRLTLACDVTTGEKTGNLHTAAARGGLVIDGFGTSIEGSWLEVNGLGATAGAAREEALQRLGGGLTDSALTLLTRLTVEPRP
jgi:hypothetical protein